MTSRAAALGLLVAGLLGLAVSVYLTVAHYADVPLVCATNSAIDCGAVTTSRWSLVPGTQLPVAGTGVLWFLVSTLVAAVALAARTSLLLARLHLAWCLAGALVVLYLVFGELAVVHRVCEWCTAAHALALFSLLLAQLRLGSVEPA